MRVGGAYIQGMYFWQIQGRSPGVCPPPPSQGLDPALDRSMNGGGGLYWKFTVVDS